jgi:acetyl-CoA acetyltransferase
VRSEAYAVVQVNDAASETALVHELELGTDVARQCALAATYDDRYEKEMELVDQACGDGSASELGTTDGDVGSRGLLQPVLLI